MKIETYSQLFQDLLVLKYLNFKQNGTYLDIGAHHPTYINNTYTLEKNFGWKGISIDKTKEGDWKHIRPDSKLILSDVFLLDLKKILEEFGSNTIDFLSLDLEPPDDTLKCLKKIPFDKYIFNFIAFEVDGYREGGSDREKESRDYLKSFGYKLIGNINNQDDFYIHNSLKFDYLHSYQKEEIIITNTSVYFLDQINSI